jgi:hypothetical protein
MVVVVAAWESLQIFTHLNVVLMDNEFSDVRTIALGLSTTSSSLELPTLNTSSLDDDVSSARTGSNNSVAVTRN